MVFAKNKKTTKVSTPKERKVVKTLKVAAKPFGFLAKIGNYFKGAWVELRQVRWPNRAATWSLTIAVLLFSAFFVILITLLDAGFKSLFELILK